MSRAAALAAVILLTAGCGRASALTPAAAPSPAVAATAAPSPTPSPSASASSGAQPWQILLSGSLSGSFAGASSTGPCGPLPGGLAVQLPFQYQGRAFLLDVAVQDYTGPGSYPAPPARISVHSAGFGGGPPVLYSGVKGTLAVAAGGTSGSVDEELAGQGGPAHVAGTWHC